MELSGGPAKKQKWMKKRTAKSDYLYFDYETDMLADPFLASVTSEEKNRWYPDLQEQLKKTEECGGVEGEDGTWYFVFSGPGCGLYKSYTWFTATRDAEWEEGGGSSKKATRFCSRLGDSTTRRPIAQPGEGYHNHCIFSFPGLRPPAEGN